ncbi:cell division initiation protein [Streptomyces sp. CAU 1734]|uniref:cell division initiation protein n=1 Tax=Streptomyces sp. CAU 1734 TaxID=3140360 RepID=UPI003260CCCC
MDVQQRLDDIVRAIGSARSMPMSASCVVNRSELLSMLEEVRQALPGSLAQAQELIGGQEEMVARARREADRIIESAHAERGSLIAGSQVARQSQDEADRILADARREAEEIRAEADDYVDSKLANFEVVLTKTIGSVDRGREKLLGRGPGLDADGFADADAPEHSSDPQTLIHRADAYVDAKLGAFEAVLSKTLEAVGRGRQTLLGRTTSDALGEHMAAQDAAGGSRRHSTDADYLAGLAELADPEPRRSGGVRAGAGAASRQQAADPWRAVDTTPPADPRSPAGPPPPPPLSVPLPAQLPPAAAEVPQAPAHDPFAGYQPQQAAYEGYPRQDAYQDPGYQQQGYEQYAGQGYEPQAPQAPRTYGHPQGQEQPGYGAPYGAQDPYAPPAHDGYGHGSPQQQPRDPAAALDETSFFDTGMIDLDQLRRYEQGH